MLRIAPAFALAAILLLVSTALASPPESPESPEEAKPADSGASIWSDPVDSNEFRSRNPVPLRGSKAPEPDSETGEVEHKDGEWLAVPIPFANPTLGGGLGLFTGYIFPWDREDTVSPPSTVGLGGFYATNGSWGAFGGMQGYFAEDNWRLRTGLLYASLNVDFYGIGHDAGEKGDYLRLNQEVTGGLVEVTRFIGWETFLGPRIQAFWVDTSFRDHGDLEDLVPEDWLSQQMVALGVMLQRDSRDSVHYPTDGSLFELTFDSFKEAWGSDEEYDAWEAAFNQYVKVADRTVLAGRLFGRFTFGDVPYFALSQVGRKSDLRGYNAGQYRDRHMLAGQVEARHFFTDDFGAVVFGGAAAVSPEMTDWNANEILPSLGAGLRYTIAPENRVNFRFDVAWGSEGWAFYFGVGEAF